MKLYIISGLGADKKILEKLVFNSGIEPVHIPCLIPEKDENFYNYVQKIAEKIDDSEEFYLLGYSFGGILVQEIHKIKPAKKVVILGSIRSDHEKSKLMKICKKIGFVKYLPLRIFSSPIFYSFLKKIFDSENPMLMQYFQMKDPYYLKWSINRILQWKSDETDGVIQILADKDIIFPLKNSRPDFVIKNATHLFPITKHREVSKILETVF